MSEWVVEGRAFRFGADINTDVILPSQYMNLEPREYAAHAMEPIAPDFADEVEPGDVVVAERNFGVGSSREQAVLALAEAGVGAVLAESFARIFYRNAINEGLPALTVEPSVVAGVETGEEVVVDVLGGTVENCSTGETYRFDTPAEPVKSILEAGGAVGYYADD